MKKCPKYTIITVCYNAENTIERTIRSLLNQTFSDYEYIIKDGGSTDKTLDIINSLVAESEAVHIVSEPDQGIYDAMNTALDIAQGEYIYFLNAGDVLSDDKVLDSVHQALMEKKADIVYGNVVQVSGEKHVLRKYGHSCAQKVYFLTGDCICHQAMFAARELFGERQFDISYHVCADKEWQLYQITQKKVFEPLDFTVAEILTDGFSLSHLEEFENESMQCVRIYVRYGLWIYKLITMMKHNTSLVKILRKIEKAVYLQQ